jgi:hypothetical protein
MTPVIFTRYSRRGLAFTQDRQAVARVAALNARMGDLAGTEMLDRLFFIGRIGFGPMPRSRSTRMAVTRLLTRG